MMIDKRPGFTMIQLLVVLALLLFLLVALLPAVQRIRQAAARTHSVNNLKQIGIALHSYHDVHKHFPAPFDGGKNKVSLHVQLLPYIEQANLYNEYFQNGSKKEHLIPVFVSSQAGKNNPDPADGIQNYAANLRLFADASRQAAADKKIPALKAVVPGRIRIVEVTDGSSNTVMFATKYGKCGMGGSHYLSAPNSSTAAFFGQNPATTTASPTSATATFQLAPTQKQCRFSPLMAQSFTTYGMEILLVDGSVHFLRPGYRAESWNHLLNPYDGAVIDPL